MAYLIKNYGKYADLPPAYQGDPVDVQVPDIISEDNIEQIAQDIALEEMLYISDIELAMNEKLTQAQNAQVEVVKFQAQVDTLKGQIATEVLRIDSIHIPKIQKASIDLAIAKEIESEKYSEYMNQANTLTEYEESVLHLKRKWDTPWGLLTLGLGLLEIKEAENKVIKQTLVVDNAWLTYLDSQNAREQELNNYNSALLAKANDSTELIQLRRDLIASTNSLNTWKIAYQASMNVYNQLNAQLTNTEYIAPDFEGIAPDDFHSGR